MIGLGSRLRARVLELLADNVERSGAQLMRELKVSSGSLYSALFALEDAHKISSRWEVDKPQPKPRRRLYRIAS